ncbi:hypothetical protein N5K27_22435 [Pigmentiphaga sp. GD03639]|uniref:hypothetical protein n=1 Tax=Pigmentiphaga sp. GD03639 TaxID=2975354 RepID=UPI002447BFC7|nr:hypothetical protein [Pigmentiphaga sp. GD03639]MDH2239070.1 hypothetical protein [Pigmentiphaga sp. GD03639]
MSDDQPLIPNPPRVAFVDSRTGMITPEWYRWILRLTIRVGGAHSPSLDELARHLQELENEVRVAPPDVPPTADDDALLGPAMAVPDPRAADAALLAVLAPAAFLQLYSELLHVRAEMAEMQRRMDDLMKGPSPWQ